MKIYGNVYLSEERFLLIQKMTYILINDLKLDGNEITVMVDTYREIDGDGCCMGGNRIDIVNKRSSDDLFKVISHEMKHLEQYRNGDLEERRKKDCKKYSYEDLPWEVEAFEYEKDAFKRLFNDIK